MKKIWIPLLLVISSCGDQQSQTNFDKVKAEHPHSLIYSETPQLNGKEWVVRDNDKIYNVVINEQGIPTTTLLVERYNPAYDTVVPKKDSIAPQTQPEFDSIKKINDSIKHK